MPVIRTSIVVVLLTGLALVAPSGAVAAINLTSTGGVTTIIADPGTADQLNVQQSTCVGGGPSCSGTAVRVDSETTPLVAPAGQGCFISTRNGYSQGICPASTTIDVDTGDGDDVFSASENARALPPVWNISLGDGNDTTEFIETDGINTIDGGPGDDTIDGENIVYGGDGNDTLTGETLNGGPGNDLLTTPKKTGGDYKVGPWHGDEGNDILKGNDKTPFDDKLFGDDGKDKLFGGAGRDILNGGADKDTCDGGPVGDKNKSKADIARGCEKATDVYVKPKKK